MEIVELWVTSNSAEKENLISKIKGEEFQNRKTWDINLSEYLIGENRATEDTGYVKPNLKKFCNMMLYFSEAAKPYKTKMNKLLFYADFLNFKKTCFSISGAKYRAIQFGPVPNNFQRLYEFAASKNYIEIDYKEYADGKTFERYYPSNDPSAKKFNSAIFNEDELRSLKKVADTFKKMTTKEIVNVSHEEVAWLDFKDGNKIINYDRALRLKTIE